MPGGRPQTLATIVLALVALATAARLAVRAQRWNDELAIASPLARMPPLVIDPHTPRLARRVVVVVIDGLGADEARLPFLDELRARGAATTARVPYPTISRPNYVTLLSGVPPADSGVRANRVRRPVLLDTALDRARAAGLRVASASDYGMLPSLFVRGVASLDAVRWTDDNMPAPPASWPVDVAERTDSLAALAPAIARFAASDDLTVALVLDVDRAGHAHGIGDAYRAAARDTDAMLRAAFASVDLSRDTVIVTADHGHVAPGGHGGVEREVSTVPLVLAGAGIAAHAIARDARSIDLAPTVNALLGLPSPGHAEGRALVELLGLSPADAARRAAADRVRAAVIASVVAAARRDLPDPEQLVAVAIALALAACVGAVLQRKALVAIAPASLLGVLGIPAMLVALGAMTRGHYSPSYVPSLPQVELIGGGAAMIAIAVQVVASVVTIRRRRVAGNGVAFVGLVGAVATVAVVRAWYGPPVIAVPSPFWFVAVPAIELGAATACVAISLTLAIARR